MAQHCGSHMAAGVRLRDVRVAELERLSCTCTISRLLISSKKSISLFISQNLGKEEAHL